MIVSADRNWGIGKSGRKLLDIPDDRKFVRDESRDKTVIMGRKTFETVYMGKALPDRLTIVLSTDPEYKAQGVTVVGSVSEALDMAKAALNDIYILGGESVFKEMLEYCDEVQVTSAEYTYDADAFMTDLDKRPEWVLGNISEEQTYFDVIFYYKTYIRRKDYRA